MTIPLNPLAKVTDYQSMLRRIFVFTTFAGCVAVMLLRLHSPAIDSFLGALDIEVDFGPVRKVKILGYLLPAGGFAVFAYSIRLHDRLSDLFRIRYIFDTRCIIRPMAERVGVDPEDVPSLYKRRHKIMREIFYGYVSSTNPVIDKHSIYEALDSWTWLWVLVEAWFVFVTCGIALVFLGSWQTGLLVAGIATVSPSCPIAGLLMQLYSSCERRN